MSRIEAWAPGRVNLIGEHVDHRGGVVLPMAIEQGTTLVGEPAGDAVELTSTAMPGTVRFDLPVDRPELVQPAWGRYVAGVAAAAGVRQGIRGVVHSDLPIGAGLSSSAALEVAAALALGIEGDPATVAALARDGEERATGVPCGIMDQLASVAGVAGHALRIDCTTLTVEPVAIPPGAVVQVVDSGEHRRLAESGYARRRAECDAAEEAIGPLRLATTADLAGIDDPVLRRRARHVVTELARVDTVVAALRAGDIVAVGEALTASHRSLRDDFEVSTPGLDALVEDLLSRPGVLGARLVGAGFGGSVVVWCRRGTDLPGGLVVEAAGGARVRRTPP